MSRYWIVVVVFIVLVLALTAAAGSRYPSGRFRSDPLPPSWIGKSATVAFVIFIGVTIWAYCCQDALRQKQLSLKALLGLLLSIAAALQTGLLFVSAVWPY